LSNLFKQYQHISFSLLFLAVSSCALIQPTPDALDKNIQNWLNENEFDTIDNALSRIDKDNSTDENKYQFILDQKLVIETRKKKFIENTSTTAQKLKQSNEWQQALDTYNNALQKIRDEPRLTQEKIELLNERDKQVKALKKDMLMQRANALISYKKVYEKLSKLIPEDSNAQIDINHYDKNRIKIANRLKLCGDQAMQNNKLIQASDCYALSNQLEPTDEKALLVTNINKQLIKISTQESNEKSLAAYYSAYKKHQYTKARSHLKTLLGINPSHAKTIALLEALNKEISNMTLEKINLGNELYSKKRIDEALEVWRQALLLEPNNSEVIQLISRAEKVSKKIQSLEKTQ